MKTRTFPPPSAGILRPFSIVPAAGLVCSLICPLSTTAHADSSKELPWASVMPGSEFRPGQFLPLPQVPPSNTPNGPGPGAGSAAGASAQSRAKALALYYKARRLEQEADDAAALSIYEEAMALDPGHPHLNQRLTAIYTRLGRLNEALALLEKTVRQFSKEPGPLLTLARFLDRHHNEAPEMKLRALRTAEEAVARFPSSSDAVDHLVRLHLSDQNRDKAQAVIDQALRSPSKDAMFWLNLVTPARNAYPLDDRENYEKHFSIVSTGVEKALKLDGENSFVQELAGDFFARNREPDRALALYEKAAAQRPGDLRTRQKLGQLLRMADRNVEAISLFESLVRIDPGDTVSHKALVSLLEKTDPAKSLTHRAELLRLQSGDPRDYTTTVNELLKTKRVTEALTLVKRGIFFNPQAPQLLYLQCRVLSEKGDQTAALGSFAEAENLAKEKQPKLLDSAFYYSWGSVAQRAQQLDEAEARYRQSIEKAPPKEPARAAPAYNDLGFLWITQNKNLEAAGELLRTANDLVKDNPTYLDSLGWWYFLKKDYPNALKHLRRAVELSKPAAPPELLDHLAQAEAAAAAAAPEPKK